MGDVHFLNDEILLSMFKQIAKHRSNDAYNVGHRPPLVGVGGSHG